MAHRRMMGHTGWLVVFVFVYGFGSGLCDISLTMEKTVTGYRRESVVIPCTYKASNNEDIIKIEWEFQSHLVIYRADEQDHIPLSKYRERAVISKSPSGDVSLTLRRLDMDDRGNFKCKVTGRDRNGKLITQEHVTILKVLRTRPPTEQPKVTTAEDAVTTRTFITVNSDVEVSSVGEEPKLTTENVVTETPHMETEQTTRQNVKTRIFITVIPDVKVSSVGKEPDLTTVNQISNIDDHNKKITPTKNSQTVTEQIVTETPNMETETTAWRDLNTRASNEDDSAIARTKQPRKFHSSSFPAFSFTTPVMHNNPPAEAIKTGSGIFFYTLIIGLLCIVSVLIVTIVLIARRKKTKSHNYNLPTMNQLALNLEGRSCEAASNSYEPDFPVSQYEQLPMCSNEYEQLVLKNPEGNDSQCQSSK
ncbi:V-set and immunoglobulin domain-containing protein 4 isoform X5 [Rana temporaria]|uniref:V-set and immunoglobulin domain-containing protein 4 isoform X5 n=1 Tax=Rana temporaria TaxID=8407 RepID=UPI001AADD114|nr:V-set and immunoglobulin domain-containing protein 4 isoform X5 [Rana temporaria]